MIRDSPGIVDVSIDRIRDDFKCIFDLHKITVNIIRDVDSNSGDFFSNPDTSSNTFTAEISLQGTADAIRRLSQGITVPKGLLSCYVEHTTDILATDELIIYGVKFKIDNVADGIKSGLIGFRQFDLVAIKRVEA